MKLLLFFTIACIAAGAYASEIHLQSTDIYMKCEKAFLILRIPKIENLTLSKADTFSLSNQNQSVCLALKEHLSKSNNVFGTINSSVRDFDTYIDEPTCNEDTCYVTHKTYKLETIDLYLSRIPFKAHKEIPGSIKLRKVYWGSDDCPPLKPDCNL